MKSTFEKKKIKITLSHLLKNNFHIGDKVKFWHPSMNPFVLGTIDVIPLTLNIHKRDRKFVQAKRSVVAELSDLKKRKRIKKS